MEAAPLFEAVAEGPGAGQAWFLRASDGVRLRIALWGREAGRNGTVLLFPGRTEYIEKYGRAAADLADRGFATLVVDWRGQGLADRLLDHPNIGHIPRFTDYQRDVAAVMAGVAELDLPQPLFLIAHSMGGAIGYRALLDGLSVRAVVFSAPMWGLTLPPIVRGVAWALTSLSRPLGFGNRLVLGTKPVPYQNATPFPGNTLTTDAEMYAYMGHQTETHPELAIGGPSFAWLNEALREGRILNEMASPKLPGLVALGMNERVVHPGRIIDRVSRWSDATLLSFPNAEHEIMMETPGHRTLFFDSAAGLFVRSS